MHKKGEVESRPRKEGTKCLPVDARARRTPERLKRMTGWMMG
jgi:hypothetical protein